MARERLGGFSEDQLCYAYDMLMLVLALNHFFLAVTAAAANVAAVAAAGHTRTELRSFKGRCHRSHTGAVQRSCGQARWRGWPVGHWIYIYIYIYIHIHIYIIYI